ncbi:uncharacterized protein MONOS_15614 [Monocercomonoides exilis]|uniref:uncharacterized protein n=1 Tax=Monocercomonoides exilis TaxID=2049356 RepID=UPI00355AA120|nr:hypothetical protein MONOS_15614 [Monocercomonoides exilis]|eukprot:MONOS_15614.1-p1 / transcript=MONOS_15614.1 / gene=MONOS_15614 / organism=Monocercomonoides_exilis_PA203 / gene_product=unspecified product / transcript_product=unspecified product / location=Mono_scaffold01288:3540-4976(-) / protein_length=479 / sequence_SO=supercontig / SO=protein_coding / is_pseudo=false
MSTQTSCLMNSCSFSSVCDAYDGGIVHSLNNTLVSLTASNTSFIGCCRTRNVEYIGTSGNKKQPGRQNETFNGANSFIWCEWDGSKTAGKGDSWDDGTSSGGAICMFNLGEGVLSILFCKFNSCYSDAYGGGVFCHAIKTIVCENSTFSSCTAQANTGGGIHAYSISTCARISGCEFQNCKANGAGGGLLLENFQVSGTGCIEAENEGGESACVFDCSFTSCSVSNTQGGGMRCYNAPVQFKMRNIRFISCNASSYGGGLSFDPNEPTPPGDGIYCFFLFFHECKCRITSTPYGHDVMYYDYFNLYLESGNPFHECYTTNTDDKRVCYAYNASNSGSWVYDQTMKMDWLKRGILNRFVAVSGGNAEEFCGANESYACRTIDVAVEKSVIQVSLSVTLMGGDHTSETTTINIETKKISVIGKGKDKSLIGTGALSSIRTLFSVSTGRLGMRKLKIDCNSAAGTSPSVVVVFYERKNIFT